MADTSITTTVFVDIDAICKNKGYTNSAGDYTVRGSFANGLIADDKSYPTWIGYVKSNWYRIVIK